MTFSLILTIHFNQKNTLFSSFPTASWGENPLSTSFFKFLQISRRGEISLFSCFFIFFTLQNIKKIFVQNRKIKRLALSVTVQ